MDAAAEMTLRELGERGDIIKRIRGLGRAAAVETGQPFNRAAAGEYVAGSYRQPFALASGRHDRRQPGLPAGALDALP